MWLSISHSPLETQNSYLYSSKPQSKSLIAEFDTLTQKLRLKDIQLQSHFLMRLARAVACRGCPPLTPQSQTKLPGWAQPPLALFYLLAEHLAS